MTSRKVYKGAHCASIREFAEGQERFLATVSTFTSNEIMDYKLFVETTVLMAMITLPRVELNKKVVVGPEIQEVLHQSPMVKSFLDSLYVRNSPIPFVFFWLSGESDAPLPGPS